MTEIGLADHAPRGEEKQGISPAAERPLRVLIVEDEALVAIGARSVLSHAGMEIVGIATHKAQAAALAEQARPDLVLMDVTLRNGEDGVEAALDLLNRFGLRSVFVTAHSDPISVARSDGAQPLGYVFKPYTSTDLANGILKALANR